MQKRGTGHTGAKAAEPVVEHTNSCIDGCGRTVVSYNKDRWYMRCTTCATYRIGRKPTPEFEPTK